MGKEQYSLTTQASLIMFIKPVAVLTVEGWLIKVTNFLPKSSNRRAITNLQDVVLLQNGFGIEINNNSFPQLCQNFFHVVDIFTIL